MSKLRNISDKMTTAVATQLAYFDMVQGASYEEVMNATDEKRVIERYRNDRVFHAKVTSMVAALMQVVTSEIEE